MKRRELLSVSLAAAGVAACGVPGRAGEAFVCPPCGCAADHLKFDAPGVCPACDMTLMPSQEHRLGAQPLSLPDGAGVFEMPGFTGAPVQVHYYLPAQFAETSPVLIVVPGSGRNAAEYRNVWLERARRWGMLVAAVEYPSADYDFAAYQMGGLITSVEFRNVTRRHEGRAQVIEVADEDVLFEVNANPQQWIFGDFDRLFLHLKEATGSRATHYDLFGHSAGAQIAHRFVLCQPQSKARRVIAANAGFYTLPTVEEALAVGLAGTGVRRDTLRQALAKELVILLGAEDNHEGAGGTLLRTPRVDQQGLDRLSRGRYFYSAAKDLASRTGVTSRWQLHVVEGVGHDFRAMSHAAAEHLGRQ